MKQTVIGIYDSYADACAAQRALTEAGLEPNEVSVFSNSVKTPAARGPRVYAPGAGETNDSRAALEALERLFSRLFRPGDYPPEAEDYREFVRRGGTIVSVNSPDSQVDLACELMRRAGAADVEERARAWRGVSRATGAPIHDDEPGVGSGARREGSASSVPHATNEMRQVQTRTSGHAAADDDFRGDFDTNYASSGASYDDYQRAYSHGATFAQNEQYRGRDWHEIEPLARENWESHYPDSAWERFKAAVRHGWEKVTRTQKL